MEQRIAQKTLQTIYNKRQVVEHFKIKLRTVDNWMSRGLLPYLKIGRPVRIPMPDAEAWMREKCQVRCRGWQG